MHNSSILTPSRRARRRISSRNASRAWLSTSPESVISSMIVPRLARAGVALRLLPRRGLRCGPPPPGKRPDLIRQLLKQFLRRRALGSCADQDVSPLSNLLVSYKDVHLVPPLGVAEPMPSVAGTSPIPSKHASAWNTLGTLSRSRSMYQSSVASYTSRRPVGSPSPSAT
jgi:hypothetical protein